ncbi:MAG: replication initiation factor [Gammaproteobacteria bacterium]
MQDYQNERIHSGEEPEGAAQRPLRAADQGTAPSNTVPCNSRDDSDTTILRTGIDTLYLSYQGDLFSEQAIRLSRCKELAQSSDPQTAALAQMELGSHLFEVADKGRGIYPYVLRDAWYQLQVSKQFAQHKPLVFALISSGLLTTKSLPFILDDLSECVGSLGQVHDEPNLGRLDLCCDFVTGFPMSEIRESQWLTRARHIDRHEESKQFTGFSIGRGGEISARLYNKTIEMRKNPRPYLEALWREAGWNEWDEVWRLEFQFRREALKEFGALNVSHLDDALAGLWRYASTEWLRLVIPNDSDSTSSRWPTASVWEALQAASWNGNPAYSRKSVEAQRLPPQRLMFVNGLGGLTSFMAINGYARIQDGLPAFVAAAREYHDSRKQYTGVDFESYLLDKIRVKQRQFNVAVNVPAEGPHPADKAVADSYRRAKDGE